MGGSIFHILVKSCMSDTIYYVDLHLVENAVNFLSGSCTKGQKGMVALEMLTTSKGVHLAILIDPQINPTRSC